MRTAVLVALLNVFPLAFAAGPESRPASDFESDHFFLMILRDQPEEDSLQMLATAGVADDTARNLLRFLEERKDDYDPVTRKNYAALCENADGRFSSPDALARELQRWLDEEREFQAGLVREAATILGVDSLSTVRAPVLNNTGVVETGLVEQVLGGKMTPAFVIARACEFPGREQATRSPAIETR